MVQIQIMAMYNLCTPIITTLQPTTTIMVPTTTIITFTTTIINHIQISVYSKNAKSVVLLANVNQKSFVKGSLQVVPIMKIL